MDINNYLWYNQKKPISSIQTKSKPSNRASHLIKISDINQEKVHHDWPRQNRHPTKINPYMDNKFYKVYSEEKNEMKLKMLLDL